MTALVSVALDGQLCGIDVAEVRDVLGPQAVTPVPLAPRDVTGLLNLRGRIVTAIDLRRRLGLADRPGGEPGMNVVIEQGGELYSLAVDSVGEVLRLPADAVEPCPATLDPLWRRFCGGVCRLEDRLMVVLDGAALLDNQGERDEALPGGR